MPHQIKVFLDNQLLVDKPLDLSKTCEENQSTPNRSTTPNRITPTPNRSTTADRRVVIVAPPDFKKIPHEEMKIDEKYYYIDPKDGTTKRGTYYQYDNITGPDKPYIIKKEEKDAEKSGIPYVPVNAVYLRYESSLQRRGGKRRTNRRTKRSKKRSRKSRKNR